MTDKTDDLTDETGVASADPKHAPVSFPAGSFDMTALRDKLEAAVEAKPEERDAKIEQALKESAGEGTVLATPDTREMDGYKFVEVENKAGSTDLVQVLADPKAAAEHEASQGDGAADAGEPNDTTKRTTRTKRATGANEE